MASKQETYADHLSQMIACETISPKDHQDIEKFYRFHNLLEELYPLIHRYLEKVDLGGSLLFRWKGSLENQKPILFMSHMDVVPAPGEWKYPAFSGAVAEGNIWGRGTVDTKGNLCAILEAVEKLLGEEFVPKQDIYIASSHTEEIMGVGAPNTVAYLQERGVKLDLVLDEGGAILDSPMPGLSGKFAMLGIMEKGFGNVKFTARAAGGHASMPSKHTPIARLSEMVTEIEKHTPFKKQITAPLKEMFCALAPHMAFPYNVLFGNTWLFGPVLRRVMPKASAQAGAMLATSCAFTMAQGSLTPNVLPQEASIVANMRFMIHQNMEETLSKLTEIASRYDVQVELLFGRDCSKVTDPKGVAYTKVESAVKAVFEGVIPSPYIMLAGTDAINYEVICDSVIRFAPLYITKEQMASIHTTNENLGIIALTEGVAFYEYLIKHYS